MKKEITIIILGIVAIFILLDIVLSINNPNFIETNYIASDVDIYEITSEEINSGEDIHIEQIPEILPTQIFMPFTPIEEKLKNFKYQMKLESGETEYHGHFNLDGTSNYQDFQGISTFRGSNYRQNAFYGNAEITERKLEKIWTNSVGQTDNWTGVGWNGQPSIVQWSSDVRKQMNLYDEFKEKDDFVEVIYGSLDSYVHFYDLETGKPSRDPIYVTSSIKGSVTVDPRGYPLLYVGQGINVVHGNPIRIGYHIFSLIDGKELYFINGRDSFAYISWPAFDGNPVIDAKTDSMILPSENGVVYIVNLHTQYDMDSAIISVSPITTRYRYTYNGKAGGMENSMAVYKNYGFFSNNNGTVQCLDLNTLTPIWAYQMEDDCDSTIGIEEEGNDVYLYVACEVDKRRKASPAYAKKLNARTGEVIWEYSCVCQFDESVNGGVLASPIIGKSEMSDIVVYSFSKTTTYRNGKLVALKKSNGEPLWEKDLTYYAWSSPIAVYDTKNQESYIVLCDSVGIIYLIDPHTGETITSLNTGGANIEGSAAIFDNHIIIGTRGKKIYRIDIK